MDICDGKKRAPNMIRSVTSVRRYHRMVTLKQGQLGEGNRTRTPPQNLGIFSAGHSHLWRHSTAKSLAVALSNGPAFLLSGQLNGREQGSTQSREYALRDPTLRNLEGCNAARAYLLYRDPEVDLRQNYIDILEALKKQFMKGRVLRGILGKDDTVKCIRSRNSSRSV
uniref:Uncharacterized protein n=1 Tax=Chromera velia CCMP2878 TaxID=1169474 RepID=A0A0G4HJL4_9ALVE|eukprot:Cvel_7097.t1-p1 / transcript=Cvel_7097.t1 / gene=Cvel_7097 / organism=Chromera_velia_CCMP2878 / gene_product=hypothetical protein / transcript_product=hypothetical protein / location=Cvel_scaffold363:73426-76081(+) / protein_length=167 / sequence_SO=supercontig / SO=protein_coding / is_pseudo=false